MSELRKIVSDLKTLVDRLSDEELTKLAYTDLNCYWWGDVELNLADVLKSIQDFILDDEEKPFDYDLSKVDKK